MNHEEVIYYAKHAVGIITGKRPSIALLARYVGANRTTVHRWLSAESIPSYKNYDSKLEALVKFYFRYQQLIQEIDLKIQDLSNG